ncbi:MAG: cell division protein FtsA, partial [Chloroflexi bacterium]|nr:cell division protein FtsA [Chloroflexota bacterium]
MKPRMVAAVDIGSSKVCSLLANVEGDSIQVVGMGICPSRGIQKGMVTEIDQAAEAIKESVRRAEQTSGERIGSVYLGITGSTISSQGNKGMISTGRNPRLVSQKDVNRALATARQYEIPEDRRLLHVIPTQYSLDGQAGVKDPKGMKGFRLDVDTHIVTITEGAAENIIKSARKAGLNIEGLVLQCLASAQAVLQPEETDAGVVLVEIGAGTTGLSTYKNGSIELTAVLPVGGNQITRDLAIGLGIPFEVAERIKKEHCDLSGKDEADDSEGQQTVTINFDGVGKIFKKDLNDIVRARVEEMVKMAISQLPDPHARISEFPAGLVLVGGTANLAGIEYVAHAATGLPVRVGMPDGMSGLADTLYNPAYASSVGLLLCSGKWHREQNWIKEGFKGKLAGGVKSIKQHVPRIKIVTG